MTSEAASISAPSSWGSRLAALLEVVGVFLVATLLARLVGRGLGLGPANLRSLGGGVEPDFIRLSWNAAGNLFLRYGLMLGLGFAIGWWHRKRRLADYGVTKAGRSFRELIGIALLLFAVAGILPVSLKLVSEFVPMGRAPDHWTLIQSLQTPGVWLYLFVGSFGLVPIAEELLARGYIQSRLTEDFGPPAAILITACFFTFSHTQYFISSAIGIGMLASLFLGSLAAGYVRYRTGSVIPVIIAHAFGNLPFRGWVEPVVLGAMVMLVVLQWRVTSSYAVQLWRELMVRDTMMRSAAGCAVAGMLVMQVLLAPFLLPVSAAIALAIALLLEFREKLSSMAST